MAAAAPLRLRGGARSKAGAAPVWRSELACALVDAAGDDGAPWPFACGGALDGALGEKKTETETETASLIEVDGVGPLPLPLCDADAARLRVATTPAPYGRGEATLVDAAVRDALQVDAAAVRLSPAFRAAVEEPAVEAATAALAPGCSVQATLYKMLLYEPGGHFRPHRDTEKVFGMFATLVIGLPVHGGHDGGELRVRHAGSERSFDMVAASGEGDAPLAFPWAAFYASCEHEISPVAAGRRLVLVYSLSQWSPGVRFAAPGAAEIAARLARAAERWQEDAQAPCYLISPLEHAYTSASLSFGALKGGDAAKAAALAGCGTLETALALVTKTVTASLYEDGPPCKRGHWDCEEEEEEEEEEDDDEGPAPPAKRPPTKAELLCEQYDLSSYGEVAEVDESVAPTLCVARDGAKLRLHALSMSDKRTLRFMGQEHLFDSDDGPPVPDVENVEYTGNEGTTVELKYHAAAIILWPRKRRADVGAQAGLPGLLDLADVARREAGGDYAAAPEARAALAAAAAIAAAQQGSDWGCDAAALAELLETLAACWRAAGTAAPDPTELVAALGRNKSLPSADVATALAALLLACPAPAPREAAVALADACASPSNRSVHAAERVVTLAAALCDGGDAALASRVVGAVMPALVTADAGDADGGRFTKPAGSCLHASELAARVVCGALLLRLAAGGDAACAADDSLRAMQFAAAAGALCGEDAAALLRPMLALLAAADAARAGCAPAVALALLRIARLQADTAGGPYALGWRQPGASCPSRPDVEAFLRGPHERATFTGFAGLPQARRWLESNFGHYSRLEAKGVADGRGADAHVVLTKTRDRRIKQHADDVAELARLQALLPQ